MMSWRNAPLYLAGACITIVCGFAGCNKAPTKADPISQQTQTGAETGIAPTADDRSLAAQAEPPPLPDPSRTDPEAVAMRKRNYQWLVAKKKLAAEAALKAAQQGSGAAKN
jgi:hypothetical protein